MVATEMHGAQFKIYHGAVRIRKRERGQQTSKIDRVKVNRVLFRVKIGKRGKKGNFIAAVKKIKNNRVRDEGKSMSYY
jgi:hypothetical protein